MKNVLIIVGSGNPDKSDLNFLQIDGEVLCVGHAIETYPKNIDAYAMWCVDGNMFNKAADEREKKNLNTDFSCYSFLPTMGFEHLPLPLYGAGSAMYGIQLGLYMGYEKIVLVDCPLDDYCEAYREGFEEAFPLIKEHVRSMSGWTKELFGEPTDSWLKNSVSEVE